MMMILAKAVARVCLWASAKMDAAAAARARYAVTEEPAGGPGSPRVILLHDYQTGIKAAVTPFEGGELASLSVRFHHLPIELLYRARDYGSAPDFRGKAPLLWPAIGPQYNVTMVPDMTCGDGTYMAGDCTCRMPCDGFAKELPWSEAGHSDGAKGARLMLELRDSEQTRVSYPFGFLVQAAYELADGSLTINYTVSASRENPAPMPFSIGNRMAFRLPFLDGTEPDAMRFQTNCTRQTLLAEAGTVNGEQGDRLFATPTRLGDFDATEPLPLSGYQNIIPFARLIDLQGVALRIRHRASTTLPEPVVQFNVYGGPRQGFLCPAPWFGMPDSRSSGKPLVMLEPGGDWQWTVELSPEIALEPC
jgi:galactose mutarotase-like enzyme